MPARTATNSWLLTNKWPTLVCVLWLNLCCLCQLCELYARVAICVWLSASHDELCNVVGLSPHLTLMVWSWLDVECSFGRDLSCHHDWSHGLQVNLQCQFIVAKQVFLIRCTCSTLVASSSSLVNFISSLSCFAKTFDCQTGFIWVVSVSMHH